MVHVEGLDGRVAIVTGAARGIGRAIAEGLAANGAMVAALDLEAPDLPGIVGYACDVSDETVVDATVSAVERDLGIVSVAVLNAGIFHVVPFEETSTELWEKTLSVNLTGAFLCARRVLPGMREQGWGRIIMISSMAGKNGAIKPAAAYAASKAGMSNLARSIAREYAPYGVTANAIAPALIDTPMIDAARDLEKLIPVGRMGTPQDVAALACFLASGEASFITGEVSDVNGGVYID
jgi:NAD(P)-dependent dehydrogenase (short-subunit alcohol dehydrogenase family)